MDQVSPDLLLMIFKELNPKEMVSIMRVERKWLQIIDEHKALWRELVLPSKRQGWGLQAFKLFDRKSNSTLKRVSMDVAEGVEVDAFIETLEKSKDSLQFLAVKGKNWNHKVEKALQKNLWKFPILRDCRLTSPYPYYYKLSLQLLGRNEDQVDDQGSSLRVLWISGSRLLLKSHLYLLDNLVSLLLLDDYYDTSEARRILKRPSRTLKHLSITIDGSEQPQFSTLSFPNLVFLEIVLVNPDSLVFPSWMNLPSLSTLIICHSQTLCSLPACSKLWMVDLNGFDNLVELASQCPELVELKMDVDGPESGSGLSARERFENLSSMLSGRKANVEAGVEIGGVKMINLKTLVLPFDVVESKGENGLEEVGLSKLRESVEEVINLREKMWERWEIIEMAI